VLQAFSLAYAPDIFVFRQLLRTELPPQVDKQADPLPGQSAFIVRLHDWDLPACRRYDWLYTASSGLGYAFNARVSATLAYRHDFGVNDEAGVANPETREYRRSLVSIGPVFKY
jgi:hypothetical protein